MYAKIASMHGFDLGIDHEIAPRDLIIYDPLPEEEYQDIFDFMRPYDLSYPYEYLQDWIDYYSFKTDKLEFGKSKQVLHYNEIRPSENILLLLRRVFKQFCVM